MCLAIPGQILSTAGDDLPLRTGRVSFGGIVKEISLAYTPEANVGDYVIVHVGFALSTLDEKEAGRVFEYLREIGELQELESPSSDLTSTPFGSGTSSPPALMKTKERPGTLRTDQ